MADFYSQMADMTRDLLQPTSEGGLGQGRLTMSREGEAVPGANPWDPVVPGERIVEKLDGAVRGIDKRMIGTEVGGVVLMASDRQAICAAPVMTWQPGDTFAVDGKPVAPAMAENIRTVDEQFHDMLMSLMDAGALEINGQKTVTEDNEKCV